MQAPQGGQSFHNARINHKEFARIARDVFGLTRTIKLSRTKVRYSARYGSHASTNTRHNIMLNGARTFDVRAACEVLAHELWHCVQIEATPGTWPEVVRQWREENRAYTYAERPREIEARAAEGLFWQELLPCITTKEDS